MRSIRQLIQNVKANEGTARLWTVIGAVAAVVAVPVSVIVAVVEAPTGQQTAPGTVVEARMPTPVAPPSPAGSPTATSEPAARTSIASATQPAASSSALPYVADWAASSHAWVGPPDWKVLNGVLLNDGTGEYSGFKPIYAPFEPGALADYTVEAEIRVTRGEASSFGVIVRADGQGGGYAAGTGTGWDQTSGINDLTGWWGTSDLSERLIAGKPYKPDSSWHTYAVEAKGNVIRLKVDGGILAAVSDNKYLAGGQIGLWSNGYQLEVRAFRVLAT